MDDEYPEINKEAPRFIAYLGMCGWRTAAFFFGGAIVSAIIVGTASALGVPAALVFFLAVVAGTYSAWRSERMDKIKRVKFEMGARKQAERAITEQHSVISALRARVAEFEEEHPHFIRQSFSARKRGNETIFILSLENTEDRIAADIRLEMYSLFGSNNSYSSGANVAEVPRGDKFAVEGCLGEEDISNIKEVLIRLILHYTDTKSGREWLQPMYFRWKPWIDGALNSTEIGYLNPDDRKLLDERADQERPILQAQIDVLYQTKRMHNSTFQIETTAVSIKQPLPIQNKEAPPPAQAS